MSSMGNEQSGRGPVLVSVYATFVALTTITIALRVYVRTRLVKNFGLDDWMMCFGWLLFIFHTIFAVTGYHYGTDQHTDANQPPMETPTALKYWWLCEPFYVLANMTIKLSLALMLLRITVDKIQRRIVIANLAVLETYSVAYFFVFIFQCLPSSFFWTRVAGSTDGKCLDTRIIIDMTYAFSALTCVFDWTFSILPWFVVRKLPLTQRTKFLVCSVLSLGSIASAATMIRTPYISAMSNPADFLYATINVAMWSCVETGLSIIAGSAATLKPLFKEFLSRSELFGSPGRRSMSHAWAENTGGQYHRASSADGRHGASGTINKHTITSTVELQASSEDHV